MEPLSEKECNTLLKIHALTSSSFPNEGQNAARVLEKAAAKHGYTPDELVAIAREKTRPAPRFFFRWTASWSDSAPRHQQRPRRRDRHGLPEGWRELLRRAIREGELRRHLVAHEIGFAARILARPDGLKLSGRQAGAIERVLRKAGLWPT